MADGIPDRRRGFDEAEGHALAEHIVRWRRVFRELLTATSAHEKKSVAILRHAVIHGIEHPVVLQNAIALGCKFRDDLLEKSFVRANCQSANIFENEILRLQLRDDAGEVIDQAVPGIVQRPLAYHAEALAGWPSENHVHFIPADCRIGADILSIDLGDAPADGGAMGEVKLVSGGMDGVVLNGREDGHTGLLESERQPASACEKIDSYGL